MEAYSLNVFAFRRLFGHCRYIAGGYFVEVAYQYINRERRVRSQLTELKPKMAAETWFGLLRNIFMAAVQSVYYSQYCDL